MKNSTITGSEKFTTEICTKEKNEIWDDFVSQVPHSSIFQTSKWCHTQVRNPLTCKTLRLIIRSNNEIVAGVQINLRKVACFGKIGVINQGPCFREIKTEYIDFLIQQLKNIRKSEKLLYLTVGVLDRYKFLPEKLCEAGFKPHNKNLLPKISMLPCTLMLDLTKDEETLMSEMHRKRRNNLRRAAKFDFTLKEGSRDDIASFFELLTETCDRRKVEPLYNDIEYFYSFWDTFKKRNWVSLYFAEIEGKPICTSFNFTFSDTYRCFQWGWNGEYSNQHISETFFWKQILLAKEMGFKYFDFVEIDPEIAEAIRSGGKISEEMRADKNYGSTHFKLRWGGEIVHCPGMYTFYKNNFVRVGLNLAFCDTLKDFFTKIIKKFV